MAGKGSLNRQIPFVNFINGDPLAGSLKIKGSTDQMTAAVKHPPYPPRKNQLFSGGEEEEEEDGHQFCFTTGRKERFAQLYYAMQRY